MKSKLKALAADLRVVANWYEPVVARMVVAGFFQMLTTAGIVVGSWPTKVDAVLGFLTLLSTLIAGKSIRGAVVSPATHEARVEIAKIRGFKQGVVLAHRDRT